MGAGRKLAYKMFNTSPGSRQFIRRRTLRLVTGLATRHYRQCREFMEKQNADLIHVMTPDPSAMVMIQAGHDAGIPVIYQELGIPYHPPTLNLTTSSSLRCSRSVRRSRHFLLNSLSTVARNCRPPRGS